MIKAAKKWNDLDKAKEVLGANNVTDFDMAEVTMLANDKVKLEED